jgi:hypothetical protein
MAFFIRRHSKKTGEGASPERVLSVHVDEETFERFRRLKKGLRGLSEAEVMALALRSLEQKVRKIRRRELAKRTRSHEGG